MSFTDWVSEPEITHEGIMSIIPYIRSELKGNMITLKGFSTNDFYEDVKRRWQTSRVLNNLWKVREWREITFHHFYAMEMVYMCQALIDVRKGVKTSRSTLESLKTAIAEVSYIGENRDYPPLPFDYSKLNRMNITLDPKQREFLSAYAEAIPKLNLRGLLLHADPGVGKTIMGLAFHCVTKSDVTFFIVPNNAVDNIWKKEIETRFDKVPEYFISSGNKPLTGKEELVVCHFEYLEKLIGKLDLFDDKTVNVWVDESHNFSRIEAARTQQLVNMCQEPFIRNVIFASGTPVKALGAEMLPLLRCVDPLFDDEAASVFTKIYGTQGQNANDIIAHRINTFKFRIEKRSAMADVPVEYEVDVKFKEAEQYTLTNIRLEMQAAAVEMGEDMKREIPIATQAFNAIMDDMEFYFREDRDALAKVKLYRTMADEMHFGFDARAHKEHMIYCTKTENQLLMPQMSSEKRKEFKSIKSVYKYPALVIQGRILGRILIKRRIDCFSDIAKNFDFSPIINTAEKKTLIFSNYVNVVKTVAESVADKGFTPLIATGESGGANTVLKLFHDGNKYNPMAATYSTLSTAVEVKIANVIVFVDPPFRSYIREQAIARVWRKGQDAVCHVISLRLITGSEPNLSTRGIDIVEWSREMVEQILPETAGVTASETEEMINGFMDGNIGNIVDLFKSFFNRLF